MALTAVTSALPAMAVPQGISPNPQQPKLSSSSHRIASRKGIRPAHPQVKDTRIHNYLTSDAAHLLDVSGHLRRLSGFNRSANPSAVDHPPPDRVFVVQVLGRPGDNEELTIGRVRSLIACFIPTTPRTKDSLEISAFNFVPEPPLPVPVGSPVSATKPFCTRYKRGPL